jgi:hypothetical protein
MFLTIESRRYVWSRLLVDVLTGLAWLSVIIIAALALGGFSFFQPWLIVIPLAMFLAGFLRGRSSGNVWVTTVKMAIPGWLLIAFTASGDTRVHSAESKILGMLLFALPTALGMWVRRSRTRIAENQVDINK